MGLSVLVSEPAVSLQPAFTLSSSLSSTSAFSRLTAHYNICSKKVPAGPQRRKEAHDATVLAQDPGRHASCSQRARCCGRARERLTAGRQAGVAFGLGRDGGSSEALAAGHTFQLEFRKK